MSGLLIISSEEFNRNLGDVQCLYQDHGLVEDHLGVSPSTQNASSHRALIQKPFHIIEMILSQVYYLYEHLLYQPAQLRPLWRGRGLLMATHSFIFAMIIILFTAGGWIAVTSVSDHIRLPTHFGTFGETNDSSNVPTMNRLSTRKIKAQDLADGNFLEGARSNQWHCGEISPNISRTKCIPFQQ